MCQSGQEQPTRPKPYRKKDRQPRNADKKFIPIVYPIPHGQQ